MLLMATLTISATVNAQPVLPDVVGASSKGINVLSWTCQYSGLKSIAVQRSGDSVFNYVTIGYVSDLKQGVQSFIDGHPNPGDNWYRLYIAFSSDLTWYSNRIKIHIDSATLLEKGVIPPNDSLQKYAATIKIDENDVIASSFETESNSSTPATGSSTNVSATTTTDETKPVYKEKSNLSINIPKDDATAQMAYVKSKYVFTNPFTGHVTLELPLNTRSTYAIKFYTQNNSNTPVLDIPRIRQKQVIIDKRNFNKKGIYKFVLYEGYSKMDEGYITIY